MTPTSRKRASLAAGLGVLGVTAAVVIGTQSGSVGLNPAALIGIGTATSFVTPAPEVDEPAPAPGTSATAVLAGGCFWGVQGVFQHLDGVSMAESGYAGGDEVTADYETVGGGDTGHAEAVRISYDPAKVTYGQLLQVFFSVVQDPTQLNRQGPDVGSQYRSAIFAQNSTQQRVAEAYLEQLDRAAVFGAPVVTTIEPDTGFFPAEQYHQNFLNSNPSNPYIAIHDIPKVENLERLFASQYREQPVLVPTGQA